MGVIIWLDRNRGRWTEFLLCPELNEGSLVWEDNDDDATLDEVLEALDAFFAEQMTQYS